MSQIAFNKSLKIVENLLKELELLKSLGIKNLNINGVSKDFKDASQQKDYFRLYKAAVNNFDFDFLLFDDSIMQFSYKFNGRIPISIRYAFFQNPQEFKSYNDYLNFLRSIDMLTDETDEEVGQLYYDEYEQFLTEQALNSSAMTIRYDLDKKGYLPLVHSYAHFHIGHHNNVRIPTNKAITPLKFTLFIIKQIYYSKWKEVVKKHDPEIPPILLHAKAECIIIKNPDWLTAEEKELFLT